MRDQITEDDFNLPNPDNLTRAANRLRQKLRPAEPKDIDFDHYKPCRKLAAHENKLDGGKVYNISNRSSWHGCCYGSALRIFHRNRAYIILQVPVRHEQIFANSARYKSKSSVHQLRWKKKISNLKTSTMRKANRDSGPAAIDVVENVSTTFFQKLQDKFLKTRTNLPAQQCKNITISTVHQSQSGLGIQKGKRE
ncbi:unnamed protein product [Mytilus coruscus]|uniref:Uncharacterized protein n=1 Tax=Mytilus coruscus TaxID=42192 RepID=A0A6J8E7J6_MYTCO|nr:unnamed protein product [Mytilus coruscus]